jgi:hypothetical protein
MRSLFASRWAKKILTAFALSLANPIAIAISFVYLFGKLATATRGINTAYIPWHLIPAWVVVGTVIYAAITLTLFLGVRVIFKLSFSQFSSVNTHAHSAFAPFIFVSIQLILGGMEWNIAGFILVPLFILGSLVAIPASFILAMERIQEISHKQ